MVIPHLVYVVSDQHIQYPLHFRFLWNLDTIYHRSIIAANTDSQVFCLVTTVWTGDAGVLAELISLAMSRYKCSDSPLDDNELNDASLRDDDERLLELDKGRPLETAHQHNNISK